MTQKNNIAISKKNCGIEAIKFVKDGMILGLGSGSTVMSFIEALVARIKKTGLKIYGIPTSYDTMIAARTQGIQLLSLHDVDSVDLAIDGADEVDPKNNLIKGAGGAFTWEKIVASNAKKFLVLIDYQKIVSYLGMIASVPVEVLPIAYRQVTANLTSMGSIPTLRTGSGKLGPVITDFGNLIVDAKFDQIQDPIQLEHTINHIPGVLENGIFATKKAKILVGYPNKVEERGFDT